MEVSSLGEVVIEGEARAWEAGGEVESAVGDVGFLSSTNLFSSPSTLFNKASSTSVFGPLFLGTAS